MTDVREEVVEELDSHSETLTLHEFVQFVEAHHRDEGRGVGRDLLAAYADAVYFDVDLDVMDERVTDSEEWEEGERLYDLGDGRLSAYPADWHESISDSGDIRDVIAVIQREVTEAEGDQREAVTEERGVPQPKVLRVAQTVAGIDNETARQRIKELRENDEIEEFASQHRDPTLRLR
ncbi:hypothetical protein M0R88_17825 [Halorussus gelatinilyticus]|uniref:Uncharacterized protein n=1 Tax=Halorussus gelatinilyticus TaxID=2937524 RepID=A0A8U0II21_9EURY|nr:hypothetical protein [Halorussus gelatinilyticus]UPW00355.1 hypothetical protein M0R88_17825 [Halorussus gelatinilyticus]